jgi:predicted TIM-barrel fold metal-dependent hydrolase
MGSDFPIFYDDPWTRAVLPAELDPETKEKIGGTNAAALLAELEG